MISQDELVHFICTIFCISLVSCDSDLTIDIPPGNRECFFQPIEQGQILEIEYQVIDGGDLDINFFLESPSGNPIVSELRKTEAVHRIETKETGIYNLCFDNAFSRFSSKLVFFEVIIDSEGDDDDDEDQDWSKFGGLEDLVETKLEDFKESMNKVRNNFDKIVQLQGVLRSFEARDRNIMEHNFTRVNNWSLIQVIVMISVGIIQVIMVRSLFDEKSRLAKILKRKA